MVTENGPQEDEPPPVDTHDTQIGWRFFLTEFDWDRLVTNALALTFTTMAAAVLIYAVVAKDANFVATVGSVTSGITGAIVGFYFNHSRLTAAQNNADAETETRIRLTTRANQMRLDLQAASEAYDGLRDQFHDFITQAEDDAESGGS